MPSIALPVSLRGQLLSGSRFSPLSLFAASEPGVWYDPSDLTTMFQDTAGTTPVTTPGQTVALLLDKSKGLVLGTELGNAALLDKRPATDGTVTRSSGIITFTSAASGLSLAISQEITGLIIGNTYRFNGRMRRTVGASPVQPQIRTTSGGGGSTLLVGPNIGSEFTSFSIFWVATQTSAHFSFSTLAAGQTIEVDEAAFSVKLLAGNHATQATTASRPTYGIVPLGGRRNLLLATDTMATQSLTVAAVAHTLAFTGTGTVTLTGASIAGPLIGTGASNRVSLTFTPTAASLTLTVVGSVTLAQLELGSTATAYQRVGTAFDVTEAGVRSLSYLSFDGVDDFLVTPTITPGIDKAQVFAGVRKLSDASGGMLVEMGTTGAESGIVSLANPISSIVGLWFRSRGTVPVTIAQVSIDAAPRSDVLSGIGDIGGDVAQLRRNGSLLLSDTISNQGTGNYLAYPIYIGRRAGTSLSFNGQIYNLIVRFGANLDAGTITSTETFVAGKTGVTL
jgi:hypothetical protein